MFKNLDRNIKDVAERDIRMRAGMVAVEKEQLKEIVEEKVEAPLSFLWW